MNINDSALSQDGSLKVTLTAFDPARGKGQIRIEELVEKRGWFYVTVKFAAGVRTGSSTRPGMSTRRRCTR